MPRKTTISESQFLSILVCPRFYTLNYNPYKLDISQSIALNGLKFFYQDLDKLYNGLDIDNLIKLSVRKSIGQKLQNELDAYKKSIKLYSYMFVYDFIKRYPLDIWDPVLVDIKLPIQTPGYIININFDFILKSKQTSELEIVTFIHKMDTQIENNLHYFQCKAAFIHEHISLPLGRPKITHSLFYLPRYKHSSVKKRDSFVFLPLTINPNNNINYYINIFSNKISLQRNPFCLNYSCQVRKQCYGD